MTAGFTPAPNIVSKTAAADLSTYRYNAVKYDTAGKVVAISASTDLPAGILQNIPVTNEAAEIAPINGGGSSYVVSNETIAGAALTSISATGRAAAETAGNYNIGQVEDGGAIDELIVVRLGNITVKA